MALCSSALELCLQRDFGKDLWELPIVRIGMSLKGQGHCLMLGGSNAHKTWLVYVGSLALEHAGVMGRGWLFLP